MTSPFPAALLLVTALGACAASHQSTSGADYLARYAPPGPTPQQVDASGAVVEEIAADPGVDELVRKVAAVEPILRHPARIGLARLQYGRLAAPAAEDEALWRGIATRHAALGAFTIVDPLIAQLVVSAAGDWLDDSGRRRLSDAITEIRLGAARQHLDAALIYEVSTRATKDFTPLAFADVTLVGGAILPTRVIEADAQARAILIDVRNGYPYGTASAVADEETWSPSWGSDARRDRIAEEAGARALARLGPEVEKMLSQVIAATPRAEGR